MVRLCASGLTDLCETTPADLCAPQLQCVIRQMVYPARMRLSDVQQRVLRSAAQRAFEPDAVIRLFGSRLDDSRKGGDIDVLIETQITDPARIAHAHTVFLSEVYAGLGEQKVDVLIDFPARTTGDPIYAIAKQTGVVL